MNNIVFLNVQEEGEDIVELNVLSVILQSLSDIAEGLPHYELITRRFTDQSLVGTKHLQRFFGQRLVVFWVLRGNNTRKQETVFKVVVF